MKKSDFKFQPDQTVRELTLPAGGEWTPRLNGWSLIFVRQGTGYCLQPHLNRELATGAVLLASGFLQGSIRASQLGQLCLCVFNIIPERLTGLITLGEQSLLQMPPTSDPLVKVLPPDGVAAVKTGELFAGKTRRGLLFRLKLLQLFAEFFLDEPRQAGFMEIKNTDVSDAMKRLQQFMQELPVSELLEMDFNELAERTRCTSRHLSRIFCKLAGMSFTDKRAELRLEKARQLLVNNNAKVVQVALESGYNSLSQFNLMFVRRYGMSPGKWRQKFGHARKADDEKTKGHSTGQPAARPAPFGVKSSIQLAASRSGKAGLKPALPNSRRPALV